MSPVLAFLGLSILGTWGLASIGLIAGGVIMLFFPGDAETSSSSTLGGIVLLGAGLVSMGVMQVVVAPLLGLDPPLPLKAKNIIPQARMTRWARAGFLRDLPDGLPKEMRLRSQRVTLVRRGETAYALGALCSHARLPLAGLPGSPIKAYPVRDDCVMCPFHGARFEAATGRVVRQPFDSQFNDEHPFLGRLQSKLFFFNKKAEDMQTYPVRIEGGEVLVGLPK
ncbi:MAG: Rieske (2Fe-2S) protein [Tepidiformaceae bacterium]